MWKATITKTEKDPNGILNVYVDFTNTDTSEVHTQIYHGLLTEDDLKSAIKKQLDFYESQGNFVPTIGDVDLTPPPAPAPRLPSQEELDTETKRADFAAALNKLRQIKGGIALGVFDAGAEDETVAVVRKNYQDDYLNLFY